MTELARWVRVGKTKGRGFIEICRMKQPKKSTIFDSSLYPPCPSETPALTAKKWFGGDTSDPNCRDIREVPDQAQQEEVKQEDPEEEDEDEDFEAKCKSQ